MTNATEIPEKKDEALAAHPEFFAARPDLKTLWQEMMAYAESVKDAPVQDDDEAMSEAYYSQSKA